MVIGEGAQVGTGREYGFDRIVAEAWSCYEGNLASFLAALPVGAYVTITSAQSSAGQRGQRPYVDLVAVDDEQIVGVASLPSYLYPGIDESARADRRLHGLGWSEPGIPTVEGYVMDYVLDGARDEADLLATVAVATFREVWNVPHPSFLSAWTIGADEGSSGPAALSYGSTAPLLSSQSVPDSAAASSATEESSSSLRSLHVFCEVADGCVDPETVHSVCGAEDLSELESRAREHAGECAARARGCASTRQAAARVWRQQTRTWIHTAESLRGARPRSTSSGQDSSAKSTGS